MRVIVPLCVVAAFWVQTTARAAEYGGVEFPQGPASFIDSVLRYVPLHGGGPGPTSLNYTNPQKALGIPDYDDPIGSVSLGQGGLIELAFGNNLLTNSASSATDLWVFEVGQLVEDTYVAVRPTASTRPLIQSVGTDANADGFFEVGKVVGSTAGIDLNAVFSGFAPGTLQFDAVQLIDDRFEDPGNQATIGADIDAVGAIASVLATPGDTNYDHRVDFSDLLALAQHYNLPTGQTWTTGDFENSRTHIAAATKNVPRRS